MSGSINASASAADRRLPVSIVIPTYNQGQFLAATIESLLARDYPAVECLVFDDGPTDKTPAVLAPFFEGVAWERRANIRQSKTPKPDFDHRTMLAPPPPAGPGALFRRSMLERPTVGTNSCAKFPIFLARRRTPGPLRPRAARAGPVSRAR